MREMTLRDLSVAQLGDMAHSLGLALSELIGEVMEP